MDGPQEGRLWDVSGTLRKALGRLRDAPEDSGTSPGRSGRLWDVSGMLRKALGRLRDAPEGSGTSPGRSGRLWDVSGTLRKALGRIRKRPRVTLEAFSCKKCSKPLFLKLPRKWDCQNTHFSKAFCLETLIFTFFGKYTKRFAFLSFFAYLDIGCTLWRYSCRV